MVLGLLGAALLVGAILRFYNLGGPSLWNDELSTWKRTSYETLSKVISRGSSEDVHPPLYYIIMYFVQRLSDTEAMLRLPAALASLASIGALFALGKRLWGNAEGLIAAGLFAVMWMPIRYAQEARSYSLVMLFSILAVMTWSAMMRDVDRHGRVEMEQALWYVLAATVLSYLHYFGLFLAGLLSLGALAYAGARTRRHKALPMLAGVGVVQGVLYLPWLGPMFTDLTRKEWRVDVTEQGAGVFLVEFCELLFNKADWMVALAFAVMGAAALSVGLKRARGEKVEFSARSGWGFVLIWMVAPGLIAWVKSITGTSVLTTRNLLISAPAVYLMLARAVMVLPLGNLGRPIAGGALVGVALLGFINTGYYTEPHRQQFREAVQTVIDGAENTDGAPIIVTGPPTYFNYYFEHLETDLRVTLSASGGDDADKVSETLAKARAGAVWLVRSNGRDNGPIAKVIEERYSVAQSTPLFGLTVDLYRRNPGAEFDPVPEEAVTPAEQGAATEGDGGKDSDDKGSDETKGGKVKDGKKQPGKKGKKGNAAAKPAGDDTGS